jgi:murein DD-endopeptidase MepM/ murein hydrolase activator NlpD
MSILPAGALLAALASLLLAAGGQTAGAQGAPASAGVVPGSFVFAPDVQADARVEQGGLVRFSVRSAEGIDSVSAFLVDTGGAVASRGTAFPARAAAVSRAASPSWEGLIGVPSTLRQGTYRVVVTTRRLGREGLRILPVQVRRRVFPRESISLSQTLSELRAGHDPRKEEEARRLLALLSQARSENLLEWGAFRVPVEGAVRTAGFGDRRAYRYTEGGTGSAVHNGLDLALPTGRPVSACGKGRVVLAGERIVTGNSVVIEHLPGVFSLYFHLSEIAVHEGDVVEQGALVGRVGQTGLATGPHLHWEVQVLGVAVDPELFVRSPILDKDRDSSILNGDSADTPGEGR